MRSSTSSGVTGPAAGGPEGPATAGGLESPATAMGFEDPFIVEGLESPAAAVGPEGFDRQPAQETCQGSCPV